MLQSCRCSSFSQLLRYFLQTAGSAVKMAVGMALSVTGLPAGFFAITSLVLKPLSRLISMPKNSASLFAQVMATLFCLP